MTITAMELKIHDIVDNDSLSKAAKIEELQAMQTEARAIQRAASESPMVDDDGWQNDLRTVEKALKTLGADEAETGAATL